MFACLHQRASHALVTGTFQRPNLLCSFLTPNDLRARGWSPDKRCRDDHDTSIPVVRSRNQFAVDSPAGAAASEKL